MSDEPQPEAVQAWFPPQVQERYVSHIMAQSARQTDGRMRLTEVQAKHLVKLWGYGYLQQCGMADAPIETLSCRVDSFSCSHSAAANLFYADRDEDENQGTARSAGLMIKMLASKRLLTYQSSKGSPTKISLNIPKEFELLDKAQIADAYVDQFVPNDAPTVANFLEVLFHYDPTRSRSLKRDMTRGLRDWAKRYPAGLRVLRQASNDQRKGKPIALAAVFPMHPNSESNLDLSPSESLYLSRFQQCSQDPIQFPEPGTSDCQIAILRVWQIQPGFWNSENVVKLIDDTKAALRQMQADYPDIIDFYSIVLHPRLEDIAKVLGFETMWSDPGLALAWIYMPLDHFLDLETENLLQGFDFEPYNRLSFM